MPPLPRHESITEEETRPVFPHAGYYLPFDGFTTAFSPSDPRDSVIPDTSLGTASLSKEMNDADLCRNFDTSLSFMSPHAAFSKPHSDRTDIDVTNQGVDGSPRHHAYVQLAEATSAKTISNTYLRTLDFGLGVKYLACTYRGCEHPFVFQTRKEAIGHVRSMHLREKPFECTYCHAVFSRKPDAVRHVTTMNRGKKYKCSVCFNAFSRKDYRDDHEDRCLSKLPA